MRLIGCLVAAVGLAACTGGAPIPAAVSTPESTAAPASASAPPATASPAAASDPIIGEWVRTVGCEEALAAFVQAGLTDQVQDWVVGNYVAEGATASPGSECANAKAAVPHSHFFTADRRFGSRDDHGQDVDAGDFEIVDADTLSFPSAARDFGYPGDVLVDYSIVDDEVTFQVNVPTPCDDACRVAYGWALSAFFGPQPFVRK